MEWTTGVIPGPRTITSPSAVWSPVRAVSFSAVTVPIVGDDTLRIRCCPCHSTKISGSVSSFKAWEDFGARPHGADGLASRIVIDKLQELGRQTIDHACRRMVGNGASAAATFESETNGADPICEGTHAERARRAGEPLHDLTQHAVAAADGVMPE